MEMLSIRESHPATEQVTIAREILRRRMMKPQRHRLLHSFPLAAAMPSVTPEDAELGYVAFPIPAATGRDLLVGVLPHPFCNPTVKGCGFCTFPHEQFSSAKASAVAMRLSRELDQRLAVQPDLAGRRVSGLYFGGGTANLTPAESFRSICRSLRHAFDFSNSEVTLEGVPGNFIRRQPLLLDVLDEELSVRHRRISMGIQSFDENRLKAMGRIGYGTEPVFRDVVREAHRRGMTASGDLLFNLPGQSLTQMRDDVEKAVEIGLDHIGVYHLVAFRGLKTAWSQDPDLLASLPRQQTAEENWLTLRELLLERGFAQTSLTNFERREFQGNPRRFQYEECSFQPDHYEMLGLGPAAISCAIDREFTAGWKTINPDSSSDYIRAVDARTCIPDRAFRYDRNDLKAFYLTRRLSALTVDTKRYQLLFNSNPITDYRDELVACIDEGLLEVGDEGITTTARGMFYSDSISALLAAPGLRSHRQCGLSPQRSGELSDFADNDNAYGHM